jgi:uncharacterized MAPEG superfamily protein
MSVSALVLISYAGWSLCLLVGILILRLVVSVRDGRPPNRFAVAGDDVSPFSGRLCRAHANCYENLPIVAAAILVALQSGQGAVVDGLAPWLLAARVAQSVVHLISASVPMVLLRYVLQWGQVGILAVWCLRLLLGATA